MATFLLIHGAYQGGWIWTHVAARLRAAGHRVHAPTLGTTLGVACIALASMIYFSVLETRPVLHEFLIIIFILVTTPVTLIILVRAAQLRDQFESRENAQGRTSTGNRR